jgi:hypothetical protein
MQDKYTAILERREDDEGTKELILQVDPNGEPGNESNVNLKWVPTEQS